MTLHNFADLLAAARAQVQPQCLLLVFAAAELPPNATPAHRERFERGEGGTLAPVVCVDKRLSEITDFTALSAEAELTGAHWDVLFVAALSGNRSQPPSTDQVDHALHEMVDQIRDRDISRFLAVNRDGELVQLQTE